ncbi:MAG: hypothetical protein ACE5R4_12815 [Armatimonadota bacterium]
MKRHIALLVAAALLGALAAHALEHWLIPAAAHADGMVEGAFGQAARQADGSLVVSTKDTTLTLTPDGTVSVASPEQLIIGAADDVTIEGYRVKIDASSSVEIEASSYKADLSDYKLEANRIEIGEHSSEIKLAGGSDPICINDDGDITKSEKVKAR